MVFNRISLDIAIENNIIDNQYIAKSYFLKANSANLRTCETQKL